MLFLLAALLALATFTLAAPQAINATVTSPQPSTVAPVSAIPTTNCISDNFVSPWVINNLVIVDPVDAGAANPAYVSFSFYDPNEELQLTTMCLAQVTGGEVKLANGGYVGCEDTSVRFQLQGNNLLLVSRWYKDPCKGNPPYDSGIAYGQQDASFQVISSGAGAMRFQQRMEVNVTRMS